MNNVTLERSPLQEIDLSAVATTEETLRFAHQSLGYKHPRTEQLCAKGRLSDALRVAGIKPFTRESVTAYKKAQEKLVTSREMQPSNRLLRCAGFMCLAELLVGICIPRAVWPTDREAVMMLIAVAIFLPLMLAVVSALGCDGLRIGWEMSPLKGYEKEVPGFALETAHEIRLRVPEAKFYIDELLVQRITMDPFLVVRLHGEKFYVEVWEEPSYRQVRMA